MEIHSTQKKTLFFSGVDEDSFNLDEINFYFFWSRCRSIQPRKNFVFSGVDGDPFNPEKNLFFLE